MRALCLFAGSLGILGSLRADPPAGPLPAVPGYELRTLGQPKRLVFRVGRSEVEVAVPVFVYWPAAGGSPAGRRLREARAALEKLAAKPEWTAEELRQVITGLDRAAQLLDEPAPPGSRLAAGAE